MDIRSAQARDLEACLALDSTYETDYVWQLETTRANGAINLVFRETRLPRAIRVLCTTTRDLVLENFERDECFLVAEDQGAIYGYLDLTSQAWKQVAWINHLVIATERRRRGLGTALVRRGLDWARERGLTTVLVETQTKNHPATALFQKHGFSFCGFNERSYSNRDIAIFFALSLR